MLTVKRKSSSKVHELGDFTFASGSNEAETALIRNSVVAQHADIKTHENDGPSKWVKTVGFGAILAILVLSTNVALLAWVTSSFAHKGGIATIFEGNIVTLHRRAG